MENIKVILLAGYAQSGKDTVADYLVENYGYTKMKFAAPLYDMLATMYSHLNMSMAELEKMKCTGPYLPGSNVGVRTMLQTLGTEWGREYVSLGIWPNILLQKIKLLDPINKFVISDCRYLNELHIVQNDDKVDCKLWFIERKHSQPQLQHGSEQELEAIAMRANCRTIKNNGSLEVLWTRVHQLMEYKTVDFGDAIGLEIKCRQ